MHTFILSFGMNKTTVLIAAVLAVATVFAAGSTALPSSAQVPSICSSNTITTSQTGGEDTTNEGEIEIECEDLYGNFD
jgi:hypothetical protein